MFGSLYHSFFTLVKFSEEGAAHDEETAEDLDGGQGLMEEEGGVEHREKRKKMMKNSSIN